MGFLAPAVPWIVKGGAALGSYIMSKRSEKSAMKRSGEEQTALGGAQGAAGQLQQGGQNLIQSGQSTSQQGIGQLGEAGSYWSKLLGGNRAAMSQATSGARGSITDTYRGAERGLERSGVRGAQRDVAKSELNRDRAGKIAGLTTGVQPIAAQQLGEIGSTTGQLGNQTTGQGAQMAGAGGNLFASLLGQGTANRMYGRQEGEKAGTGMGRFLFDILSSRGGGGGTGFKEKIGKIGDIPGLFKGQGQWF